MNFVLWLAKRAWKPVVEMWNNEDGAIIVRVLACVLSGVISLIIDTMRGIVMGRSGDDNLPAGMIIVWCVVWCVVGIYYLVGYVRILHSQYRAESPKEKSKCKRKDSIDTSHYIKMAIDDCMCNGGSMDDWYVTGDGGEGDYFEEGEGEHNERR